MSRLRTLVDDHIRELTGVEFKIAVYLYRRMERKAASRIMEIKIADIARATGVSPKQTQTALKALQKQGVLLVDNGRGRITRCSLPPLPRRPVAVDTSAVTARRSRSAQPATGKRSSAASLPPTSRSKPSDTGVLELLVKAYDSADAALMEELDVVAGGRPRLKQCLRFMAEQGLAYETAGLLRAAVHHECNSFGSEFKRWIKHR
jgi:hypothetical protein